MQLNEIIENIQKFQNPFILIAIDGRCASGKSTLAGKLQNKLSCNVIHMDDFFLRPEQRTKERIETPGGNVDYERFLEEVLIPLKNNKDFSYKPYCCHTQSYKNEIQVFKNKISIVEGSYSCHPRLWNYFDLHIFLDVGYDEQIRRIKKRNGCDGAENFIKRWIPLEEKYFEVYKIKEKCELKYIAEI